MFKDTLLTGSKQSLLWPLGAAEQAGNMIMNFYFELCFGLRQLFKGISVKKLHFPNKLFFKCVCLLHSVFYIEINQKTVALSCKNQGLWER